jgi:hypothetical protein
MTPAHGSIWPLVLAGGVALLLFGVVTTLVFSVVGLALMAAAVVGWVRELGEAHG